MDKIQYKEQRGQSRVEVAFKNKKAILTAAQPFAMSITMGGIPAFFPSTLKTLVAPAFPLP